MRLLAAGLFLACLTFAQTSPPAAENPFKTNLDGLKTTFSPGYGTIGAPVLVFIFSDFQCPQCKDQAKMIRANLTQTFTKEVRAYFKDFPLEQTHNWAKPAAIAGRCVYRGDQPKFWNLAAPPVSQCFDSKADEGDTAKSLAEGRAMEVNSTPKLWVNGRKLQGNVSWPQLRQMIKSEIEYRKPAKNAGEDCGCELTPPSVLPK